MNLIKLRKLKPSITEIVLFLYVTELLFFKSPLQPKVVPIYVYDFTTTAPSDTEGNLFPERSSQGGFSTVLLVVI